MSGNVKVRDSVKLAIRREVPQMVRDFNARITREIKKNPEYAQFAPKRLNVQDVKNSIKSTKDFNEFVRQVNYFKREDAAKIMMVGKDNQVPATKFEKHETMVKMKRIEKRDMAKIITIKNVAVTVGGKPTGLTRKEIPSVRELENLPKKDRTATVTSRKEWTEFIESVNKRARASYTSDKDESYKQNYIKAMRDVFLSDADDIIAKISSMDASKVIDIYYSEQDATITFVYTPLDREDKLTRLREIWLYYAGEESESHVNVSKNQKYGSMNSKPDEELED